MNFIKNLKIIFFVFIVILSLNAIGGEPNYVYKNWSSGWGENIDESKFDTTAQTFTINTEVKSVFFGHSGYPYTICSNEWICLKSFGFNFAVPKIAELPKEWHFLGFRFLNSGEAIIEILGVKQLVFKIQVINVSNDLTTADPRIIYYSPNKGILGFTQLSYDSDLKLQYPETYWSVNAIGFGHQN